MKGVIGLMTPLQYRDFMEAKFSEFIKPKIEKEIRDKTRRLIGSQTPLRSDHPGWGLALRLYRWDRALTAKNFAKKEPTK